MRPSCKVLSNPGNISYSFTTSINTLEYALFNLLQKTHMNYEIKAQDGTCKHS